MQGLLPEGLEESKNQLAELRKSRDELLKASGAGRNTQIRRQTLLDKIAATGEKLTKALAKAEA